jgi:hypothetical protein
MLTASKTGWSTICQRMRRERSFGAQWAASEANTLRTSDPKTLGCSAGPAFPVWSAGSKNVYRSHPEGALTCPRWPTQSQFSDWYRCPASVVMSSERCPVIIPARASPAERQLSDWYRCPVAMVLPSDRARRPVAMVMSSERCPVVLPARASPAERQLSDWYQCPVAMVRRPVAMVRFGQA